MSPTPETTQSRRDRRHLDFGIERDELSQRLGGGLPRGSLIVIEAPYGAGKSILTQRLLYGLLQHGHKTTYVSTELTTLGLMEQMRSLDYPIDQFLLQRQLTFLPVYPLMARRRVPMDLLRRLREAAPLARTDVTCIDAFSSLVDDQMRALNRAAKEGAPIDVEGTMARELDATLDRLKRLTANGRTIVLTIEPDRLPSSFMHPLRDASDVHLGLEFRLVGATAARRIVVHRFSRAKDRFGDVVGYRVEPGVGLVIEIKSVA